MPTLPSAADLGSIAIRPSRGQLQVPANPLPGALARFGGALSEAAQRSDTFSTDTSFLQFQSDWSSKFDQMKQGAEPGATGFTASVGADYQKEADAFLSATPDHLKDAYREKLTEFGARLRSNSEGFQTTEGVRVSNEMADQGLGLIGNSILDAPDAKSLDTAMSDGLKKIDGYLANAPLTPIEKEAKRTAYVKGLTAIVAKRRVELDPVGTHDALVGATAAPAAGGGPVASGIPPEGAALLNAIAARESPGYDIINGGERFGSFADHPRRKGAHGTSTAAGRYQITAGTWDRIKAATGLRDFSPGSQDQAAWWLAQTDYKQRTGRDLTADLRAGNVAAVRAGLGPTWKGLADENDQKFAKDLAKGGTVIPNSMGGPDERSAGDVIPGSVGAGSARTGAFSGGPDDPYRSLTPEVKLGLLDDARTAAVAQSTAEAKAAKEQYDNQLNGLRNGIIDGTAGNADIQAARQSWLTDATDAQSVLDAVKTRDKDQVEQAGAVKAFNDPGYTFNPFNSDDQKRNDLAYKAFGGSDGLLNGDQGAVNRFVTQVRRTGMFPAAATEVLRQGIYSPDQKQRDTAFTVLDGMYRENPPMVARALGDSDMKRLQDYQALAPVLPPDELAAHLNANTDPTAIKAREAVSAQGRKLAQAISTDAILDAFDPGVLTTGPSAPIDPVATQQLRDDFENAFAERYAVSGNPTLAQSQAFDYLKASKWGSTDIGTGRRLTQYPPERYYPKIDGSYDWMQKELKDAMTKKFGDGIQDIGVVAYPATEAAIEAGKPVPYRAIVIDKDGVYRSQEVLWDTAAAQADARKKFEDLRAKVLKRNDRVNDPASSMPPGLGIAPSWFDRLPGGQNQ